jgi:hypothetical protein
VIDRIRRDIEQRRDSLLAEADKLRRALTALGSRGASAPVPRARTAPPSQPRRRARPAQAGDPPAGSAPAPQPRSPARRSPGSTRAAVLAALAGGEAMTAAGVASATGLERGTVSTTLSRLAKAGEITKAPRGYRLPDRAEPDA